MNLFRGVHVKDLSIFRLSVCDQGETHARIALDPPGLSLQYLGCRGQPATPESWAVAQQKAAPEKQKDEDGDK